MPAVLPRTVILLTRRALALAVPLLLLHARAQTRTLPAITLQADSPYFSSPGYIRFGQPITFSARLPVDATGTITWYVDGNAAQTTQLAPLTTGDYIAIGDSIAEAGYIGDPAQRYQAIVAAAENLSVSTYASNGYTTCNTMLQNVMPNALGASTLSNPLYSVETGANDSSTTVLVPTSRSSTSAIRRFFPGSVCRVPANSSSAIPASAFVTGRGRPRPRLATRPSMRSQRPQEAEPSALRSQPPVAQPAFGICFRPIHPAASPSAWMTAQPPRQHPPSFQPAQSQSPALTLCCGSPLPRACTPSISPRNRVR